MPKTPANIDVRGFVKENITSYDGDESFLVGPSPKTIEVWEKVKELLALEAKRGGVLAVDNNTVSDITSHKAGYILQDSEVVVGLQTDAPLKRGIKPAGGIRMVKNALNENGLELEAGIDEAFSRYRKTHNDGVFDGYTETMRKLRSSHIVTGLPDAYARGRIIGDYRRIALYGVDTLIESKEYDKVNIDGEMNDEQIRLREEVSEQIKALKLLKEMATSYGFDISRPATTATEAIQWTYFGYLAAVKEHDGAAMSLGNVSSFFDIFIEQDLNSGLINETQAQELIDQFVIKLRLIRHLRTDSYNQLFAGDPTWVTESLAGCWNDGRHKVTKTTYRFLQTLYNLGPSPEPNLTVLWSDKLPNNFKKFCAKVSIDTSSIQYENDDLMRSLDGCDDLAIACCVSRTVVGKSMQFFGARCNLAKALLLAINAGKDEIKGEQIVTDIDPIAGDILDYQHVKANYDRVIEFLVREYVKTMNVIHYMHDKYFYERSMMALIDTEPKRVMAFGIAGLSVVADSLSAIKYGQVKPIRNDEGLTIDFQINEDFPKYGNDDDRVDTIAKDLVSQFSRELHKHHIYRQATPTLSVLTITSNVVYGQNTGATPDGRTAGTPFAPGANPMHGRDQCGAIASLNSVAKIDYREAQDGISNTFTITPKTLGTDQQEQSQNLTDLINGYFAKQAQHLNVNAFNQDLLIEAMNHPELYPQLTIRVSGYAVNFNRLSKTQQQEVINRTFHSSL